MSKTSKTLADICKEIQKKYSNDIVETATSFKNKKIQRLSTGIFTLDLLTGGGIPLHRYTIFHGNKSSNKTTTSLRTANNFLNKFSHLNVIFVDFEGTYDPEWSKYYLSEENANRLFVIRPAYGEEGVDIITKIANEAEDAGMIIVDSLAAMIPIKEADSSAMDAHMGLQAKLTNRLIRGTLPAMIHRSRQDKPFSILLINQVRADFKARAFGSQYMKPCGIFQDMAASLDIRFYAKGYVKIGGIPSKIINNFTIEKNKISGAIAKRTGEFSMYLVNANGNSIGEIDELDTIVTYAKRVGLIGKENNKSWYLGRDKKFNSSVELIAYLKENKEAFNLLKEKTLEICLEDIYSTSDDAQNEEMAVEET
jgi:recombination protein RecA